MKRAWAVLARPRWLALTILMAVLVPLAIGLGFWQLDRLEERRLTNSVWERRLGMVPVPWEVVAVDPGSMGAEELRFLRVVVEGRYVAEEQVLVRNRGRGGVSGHWVVTPLVTLDGEAVAVLRGWVPFELDDPGDPRMIPPAGMVRIEGVLVPGEQPTSLGPTNPDGRLTRMALLDLGRLSQQAGLVLGETYLQAVAPTDGGLPATLELPDVSDTGPHLAYAIQWFSFAGIGVVGYAALLRRELRSLPSAGCRDGRTPTTGAASAGRASGALELEDGADPEQ